MKKFLSQLSTQINSQLSEWQENVEQDSSIVGMADFRISDLKLSGIFGPQKVFYQSMQDFFSLFEDRYGDQNSTCIVSFAISTKTVKKTTKFY
jgi:hypothetical protein